MKPQVLTFENSPQANLVILGAGPSINRAMNRIEKFKKENDAIVIAASRRMPLYPDYTVFVDDVRYAKAYREIDSKKIIVGSWFKIPEKELETKSYFILPAPQYPVIYDIGRIEMANGKFSHGLGNSGFASILIAPFFRPKKILIAGFDGPSADLTHQVKLDGSKGVYSKGKQARLKDLKIPFVKSTKIWSYLERHEIEVFSVKEDPVWGVSKGKRNVKIYT